LGLETRPRQINAEATSKTKAKASAVRMPISNSGKALDSTTSHSTRAPGVECAQGDVAERLQGHGHDQLPGPLANTNPALT